MDNELKCYITLIDAHIRDYGKAANDAAIHVCDEMWKLRIPVIGFVLKKDSGLYVIVGEDFAQEFTKFWRNPCIGINLESYLFQNNDPFWLVDYIDGDETRPRLMYYSK